MIFIDFNDSIEPSTLNDAFLDIYSLIGLPSLMTWLRPRISSGAGGLLSFSGTHTIVMSEIPCPSENPSHSWGAMPPLLRVYATSTDFSSTLQLREGLAVISISR